LGRKRELGNERLGEYVQRRSGGTLELRFPIPADVRAAFLDKGGQERGQIIRSLGTSDVRIANAKADMLRASIRADIARIRHTRGSRSLEDFLVSLFDDELAQCRRQSALDARSSLFGRGADLKALRDSTRFASARALTSGDPAERVATAGWAAERFLRSQGRTPDTAPDFQEIVDQCATVLVDVLAAHEDIAAGRTPTPLTGALMTNASRPKPTNAVSTRGALPVSEYFNDVYLPAVRTAGMIRGQNTIAGKAQAVGLFVALLGDMPLGAISKGDLWTFQDELLKLPNSRELRAEHRDLDARAQIDAVARGEVKASTINAKTVNKHLSGIKSLLDFAEKRQDIANTPTSGVRATVKGGDEAGRAFTTDELNRIFSQPLFSGCLGDEEPNGWRKAGSVKIRDDRFWIPILLLFTGARPSEIAGLEVADVVVDHEVPHILIVPNSLRDLKNVPSKRMVPIHRVVLDAGFVDFARDASRHDGVRFFPLVEQQFFVERATGETRKKGLSSAPIMRQFNRTLLADAQANGDRGSAKCFRNTFEQEAAARIASDEIRRRLTGRDLQSTVKIYTQNIPTDPIKRTGPLRTLATEVNRIAYEGVKLDHLAQ
jgi:integrase